MRTRMKRGEENRVIQIKHYLNATKCKWKANKSPKVTVLMELQANVFIIVLYHCTYMWYILFKEYYALVSLTIISRIAIDIM